MSSWRASGSSGEGVRGPVGTLESRLLFLTRQKPVAGLTPSGKQCSLKRNKNITRGETRKYYKRALGDLGSTDPDLCMDNIKEE
ncbi:uncharacterized protein isoform X2 [Castor canadensis]|uniref:Uncharacterized protein isoform X2 n=1 Tax=Castor canadensis TaxID=51338 RepID=A0AC58K2D0_CASCN